MPCCVLVPLHGIAIFEYVIIIHCLIQVSGHNELPSVCEMYFFVQQLIFLDNSCYSIHDISIAFLLQLKKVEQIFLYSPIHLLVENCLNALCGEAELICFLQHFFSLVVANLPKVSVKVSLVHSIYLIKHSLLALRFTIFPSTCTLKF